jgi:hypothetical protein
MLGAGCDGRKGVRDECAKADDEGVWSWHPLADAKSADDDRQATVTKKVMDTGESAQQIVNTIAQGMSMLRLHLWRLRLCAFSTRTQGCGCSTTPGIPCALSSSRDVVLATPGRNRAAGRWSYVSHGVVTRESGGSSIPEASRLGTTVSGILDRLVKPGDDTE